MNILKVLLLTRTAPHIFNSENQGLSCPTPRAQSSSYAGKEVIVGIRPEAIRDEESYLAQFPEATVEAEVGVVERLGFITYLYLLVEGNNITASVNRSTARWGIRLKHV